MTRTDQLQGSADALSEALERIPDDDRATVLAMALGVEVVRDAEGDIIRAAMSLGLAMMVGYQTIMSMTDIAADDAPEPAEVGHA